MTVKYFNHIQNDRILNDVLAERVAQFEKWGIR